MKAGLEFMHSAGSTKIYTSCLIIKISAEGVVCDVNLNAMWMGKACREAYIHDQ